MIPELALDFPFVMRPAEPRDEARVLDLLRMALGEKASTRKSADCWAWKHIENPFGQSYVLCAEDPTSGEIVGVRPLMRWSFVDRDGTAHSAARAVDTATHPSYQKRGIFSALTRVAIGDLQAARVEFIFNTPNDVSRPAYLKLGWQIAARWPVYVRPVRSLRTMQRAILGTSDRHDIPRLDECRLVAWQDFREEHASSIEGLLCAFEKTRTRVGYRTRRTLTYLDWRYGRHPDIGYGVYPGFDEAGVLTGFMVGRPARGARGLVAVMMTEMFVAHPSVANMKRLLRGAIQQVRADYWVAHFSRGTHEFETLAATGFMPIRRSGYTWAALPLGPVELDPAGAESWDLSLGELEIF